MITIDIFEMDTVMNGSTERKLPSRKYVMQTASNVTAKGDASRTNAAPVRPVQSIMRGRMRTEMRPPMVRPRSVTSAPQNSVSSLPSGYGNRQSSPKCDVDSAHDIQLVINDSVASAVLPHISRMISPRQRSLSASESQPAVSDHKNEGSSDCARANRVAQIVLYRRLLALLNGQTDHHLQKLEGLLHEIQQERENLIAELELEQCLKMYRLLCIENEALQSIEETLCSPTEIANDSDGHQRQHLEETTLLDRMTRLTTQDLDPLMNRLPLREIRLPTEDNRVQFAADIRKTVSTAKLFSTVSNQELEQLETLATSAEQLLERVRTSTVPQVEARQQQLDRAIRLFAHEASLRMEQMQRELLSKFENI